MICIYDKKTKKENFVNNGLGVLKDTVCCKVIEELNGDYSLELTYPANSVKAGHLIKWNIIKADGQLFRIYHVQRIGKNEMLLDVKAKHIFYDLAFFFIEKAEEVNKTISDTILTSFPKEVLKLFDIHFQSSLTKVFPYSIEEQNCVKALFGLLGKYGYEIIRDNFSIRIMERVGSENGISIRYGKNIIGILATEDTTNILTKIYPVGMNGIKLPEKYLTINTLSEYLPYPIIKKIEFSDAEDVQTLREVAEAYLEEYYKPKISVEIDFLSLHKSEEYKGYERLTKVNMGDNVQAYHNELGIQTKIRVVKIEKNLLNLLDMKVILGDMKQTIIDEIDKSDLIEELRRVSQKATDIATIYKTNSTDRVFVVENSELIFEFETFVADNINMSLNIVGEASQDLVLEIIIIRDGIELVFKPKQKVGTGENVLSIPFVLMQVAKGAHSLLFRVRTSKGEFRVSRGQFILILQGKSLEGGINGEPPYPQKVENVISSIITMFTKQLLLCDTNRVNFISDCTIKPLIDEISISDEICRTGISDLYLITFN